MQSVKEYTTFGVGGAVRSLIHADSNEMILTLLASQKEKDNLPLVIAGGSNVLFPDGYLDRDVIHLRDGKIYIDGFRCTAEAGASLDVLVGSAVQAGLAGLECLSLIPGSVGGAIVGNAGAYGQSISDHLVAVRFFDGAQVREYSKEECLFSYRSSIFKKNPSWIVFEGVFVLPVGEKDALTQKREEISNVRLKKYPPSLRCPGSFFKNIIADSVSSDIQKNIPNKKIIGGKIPAGFLLAEVGACVEREGGIYVAPYHGNLLINDGTGTTEEVIALAERLSKRVFDRFGIVLTPEVVFIS
jgi:UDP-N-acetylmuramate dehydrogenase